MGGTPRCREDGEDAERPHAARARTPPSLSLSHRRPSPSPLPPARTLAADAKAAAPAVVAEPVAAQAAAPAVDNAVAAVPADAAAQLAQATADAFANPTIAGRPLNAAGASAVAPAPGLAVPLPKFGAVPQLGLPELPAVNLNVNPAALAATLPRVQFVAKSDAQTAAAAAAQAAGGGMTSFAATAAPADSAAAAAAAPTRPGPPKLPALFPPKPASAKPPTHRPPRAEAGPDAGAEASAKHAPRARAPKSDRPSPAEVFGEGRWADGAAGGNRRLLASAGGAAEPLVEPSAGPVLTLPRLEIPLGGSASFLLFFSKEERARQKKPAPMRPPASFLPSTHHTHTKVAL